MHVKPIRYQKQGCLHFITFSCFRRMALLDSWAGKQTFERTLERVRVWYGCSAGTEGIVEIESQWAARRRGQMGVVLLAGAHPPAKNAGRVGQPREKS